MRNNFLSKLKKEEKLELVEPSEEICESYSEKSVNCLKSAKLLLQNNLYENSIGMSYYAMYNLLVALLFRVGIKCQNHSGSILLLKLLFGENDLFKLIYDAKKERIDKQYYAKNSQKTTDFSQWMNGTASWLFLHPKNALLEKPPFFKPRPLGRGKAV